MRHAHRRVLVLGGGTAGNALTVLLRGSGIDVDLVESTSDWNADAGSGITLQGNALRVLREVGVLPAVLAQGFAFDSLGITAADGTVLHVATDLRTGGADLPATVGMRRPQLQRLLSEAVRASGARVRLGTRAVEVRQDADTVEVGFSDGSSGEYDLVVIAEGVRSATRALIGIGDRPVPTGMAIWRAPVPRPRGVARTDVAYGGPCFIAGYCPTGPDTMYAYLVERNRDRAKPDPDSYADEMRGLAAGYGGAWPEISAAITDPRRINYTWFERYLVEGPWHRGRSVLAGDAAHCCPPTIAQGAAMSLEDVHVLAELLTGAEDWDDELLNGYRERRMPRVRMVVDASVRIGEWLLRSAPDADIPGLMGRTMTALAVRP
ncbi:FAD-dependent monooxygenase [Saccharopolyspora gloriosae]|uniref:FAD-dependent monooxygenase n=1 Tax=Saccharopolyspora gloriosae TaxID=455344 RepID=UPI001FB7179D|nr:FAD-dependent monooxygenase [Saccharopolyspora gloriosae]